MVYVDDAGYADFPFFNDGHPRTPHIDQLCREGIRFTQFYVNCADLLAVPRRDHHRAVSRPVGRYDVYCVSTGER